MPGAATPSADPGSGAAAVRRVATAAALRALAHPLRQRLLEQLVLFGPSTATQLAERVDDSPSNCSWHLRKLAEHGFVEEAEGGSGRQRPWRASSTGMAWDDSAADAEVRLAGEAVTAMMLERELARLGEARHRLHEDDPAWQAAAETVQSMAWLTAAELAELNAAVRDLLTARMDRFADPTLRPPGSRLCALLAWGVPTYGVAEPTPDPTGEEG